MLGPIPFKAPNLSKLGSPKKINLPNFAYKPQAKLQQGDGSNVTNELVAPFGLNQIVQGGKPIINTPVATGMTNNTTQNMPKPAQLPATGAEGEKFVSKDKLQKIFNDAPEGVDKKELFQSIVDKGYTIEGFNDQQPVKKEKNIIANIGAGVGQSITSGIAGFGEIGKSLAYAIPNSIYNAGRKALGKKQMYKDIDGVKTLVNPDGTVADTEGPNIMEKIQSGLKNYGENMGADTESIAFKAGKTGTDIAQLVTPTGAGAKASSLIGQSPKAMALLKGTKMLDNAGDITTLGKITKAGLQGALDTARQAQIEGKGIASKEDIGIGTLVGGGLEGAGQLINKGAKLASQKLQLSGLLNPKKLEYVQNALREQGDQVDNLTNWMAERDLVGSKAKIMDKLDNEAKKTYTAVRSAVKQADDIVTPIQDESVGGALESLIETVAGSKSPQKKKVYDELLNLYEKNQTVGLKPSEIQGVKDKMDDLLSLFTIAGDAKAGNAKQDLVDLRGNIRKLIEDTVGKATGADIGKLNRDTAVARKIIDGIKVKDNAETIRDLVSPFAGSAVGGLGYGILGDKDQPIRANVLMGAIGGKLAQSTTIKTGAAKALRNLPKKSVSVDTLKRVVSANASKLNQKDD